MPKEGRYAHDYDGLYNARGKRTLSKIHRGIKHGDIEKAFREVEELEKNRIRNQDMQKCRNSYNSNE